MRNPFTSNKAATLVTVYFNPTSSLSRNNPQRWAMREGSTAGPRGFIPTWMILRNGLQATSFDTPKLPTWLVRGLEDSGYPTTMLG
jgi:hypothetical protein